MDDNSTSFLRVRFEFAPSNLSVTSTGFHTAASEMRDVVACDGWQSKSDLRNRNLNVTCK
jgi:hypothetical protein